MSPSVSQDKCLTFFFFKQISFFSFLLHLPFNVFCSPGFQFFRRFRIFSVFASYQSKTRHKGIPWPSEAKYSKRYVSFAVFFLISFSLFRKRILYSFNLSWTKLELKLKTGFSCL